MWYLKIMQITNPKHSFNGFMELFFTETINLLFAFGSHATTKFSYRVLFYILKQILNFSYYHVMWTLYYVYIFVNKERTSYWWWYKKLQKSYIQAWPAMGMLGRAKLCYWEYSPTTWSFLFFPSGVKENHKPWAWR